MSIPEFSSGFKVPGSRFRVQGSGSETDAWFFANNNSELGTRNSELRKSLGLSLVELIVFIAVVGVAVAGVLAALNMATRGSADPMIQKQALAIAEAVLEEVQLQPFTYCDPDDDNAATATSTAACSAGGAEAMGPEGAAPYGPETRTGGTHPFDNVNDYNGFSMTGMTDIAGNTISGLDSYRATVAVATQGVPSFGGAPAIPADEAVLITVTVEGPASTTVVLHGYRIRYAPNALP